jgi:NAD(P)H-nitrite reductase large subunit
MHVAIIGNGISGITAARFIRKFSDHEITVISGETDFFFSRTALMYIYMGHMRFEETKPYEDFFWEKNRIQLKRAWVRRVDFQNQTLHTAQEGVIPYDKLILACGSAPNKFGWPGQDLRRVQGMVSLQDLEGMEEASRDLDRAVIVGGGLIGIEMAEMFHSRHIPVTFLVREASFWDAVLPGEESRMINRHILEHGIDLRLSTELKEILDDGNGAAKGVITREGEQIDCQFVGLTAGVHPAVDFLRDTELEIQKGILVDEHLQTNIPGVYAIGDCAQLRDPKPGRKPIEAVWYTGRMMGETVAHGVCGRPVAYDPGIWFNSAKFLDIEYQVYGEVPVSLPDEYNNLYWEHDDGKKSVRIVYERDGLTVKGFNLMGIRFRHEVCDKWIGEKTRMPEVIQNLRLANFDPEFSKKFEKELAKQYQEQTGQTVSLKPKRKWNQVFSFLQS